MIWGSNDIPLLHQDTEHEQCSLFYTIVSIHKKTTTPNLKVYLGNWPHYYKVVRIKLVFYNVLTTSIDNTHKKRKNSKTICSSETISSRICGSAPNSPNTRCHLCDLVGLSSLWHSHRRVHSAGSTFTFFKPANCTHVACHVYTTRYLGNAMQRRFSISSWTPKGYSRPPVALSSPLDLQFCSRSLFPLLSKLPLRRSSQIITCKIVFFCNKFINILNTQVLSHSARHAISDNGVCSSEGTAIAPCTNRHAFVQWDPQTSYFKTLSDKSPNRQVQEYLKWPRCRYVNVLERNGNPPLQISLFEVCFTSGSYRAVIGHLSSGGEGSRFS
jgi:hypothetical protein